MGTSPRNRSTSNLQAAPQAQTIDVKHPLYSALMANLPEAVIITDEYGRISDWNAQAATVFGWSRQQVRGRKLLSTIFASTEEAPVLGDLAARCTACIDSDAWPRYVATRRVGDSFTVALRVIEIKDNADRLYLVLARDISDALLAEQQLIQAQKLEALGHLTGGLAHDFNNILGIIIGSLDVVAASATDTEERELLAASLSAAKRGAEITKSLLAVARRRAINPQKVDVNHLMDELTPLLRQTAGKQIEVVVSANALYPKCIIDPGGLNNALLNLVINARDAMPSGGRILIYAYSTDILPKSLIAPLELSAGTYLVIGVDDDGPGMVPEVALRAFDPFFTTKERGQGTGLGLAMVYGFARQSGGTAQIQSALGKGSSVQMYIPAALET